MYEIEFSGLLIYSNLLAGHILISSTVFEIQGFDKSQKTTPTPNFGEILPRLCCPAMTLDSHLNHIFPTYFDPFKDVFETSSPWQTFSKNSFFRNISETVRHIEKMYCIWTICRSSNFTPTRSSLFLISFMVVGIKGFKVLQKKSPSPNYGEILVRFFWLGEVLDSKPSATYTEIFIQIDQRVRKITTDKLFRTDTHTPVKLKQNSFLGVSELVVTKCAYWAQLRSIDRIVVLPFVTQKLW